MSKMRRKNKKRKPSKSENKKQNTRPAISDSSDTVSIINIDNVESYFLGRNIAVPQLDKILKKMKQNIERNASIRIRTYENNITSTEQPSTSQFQNNEANNNETSNEINETKSNEISKKARRRRKKKHRLVQENNADPSQEPENPAQNEIKKSKKAKPNQRARRNARRRQETADTTKEPEENISERIQLTRIVENIPTTPIRRGKRKISPPRFIDIPVCNLPASMIIKKFNEKEKEKELHFRKPDYENCDYYAYDYETVEECAEELGPNETIEVTIDCREDIPMFDEFIPIRHYFENTRVVRLIQKCLLDSEIPPLPLPGKLFPIVLTIKKTSNDDKETNTDNNEDEIWFSWMDPIYSKQIKTEASDENVNVDNKNVTVDNDTIVENVNVDIETIDENIIVNIETINENTETAENIHIHNQIKEEKKEDESIRENKLEPKVLKKETFKDVALKIFHVEMDLKKLKKNMLEFKETMDRLKILSRFSEEENTHQKVEPDVETNINRSVEFQINTVDENEVVQTTQPSQEKVNFNDQNTVVKINSDCSKNENFTVPLCDEEINIKQFAAHTIESKARGRRIRKASEMLRLSLLNIDSEDTVADVKTNIIKSQSDDKQFKQEMKNFEKRDTLQKTSTEKVEIKLNIAGKTLIASNQTEAEVDACVMEIIKQLKKRVNSNADDIIITEQPESLQPIEKLKTIQEINEMITKRRAQLTQNKFIETRNKFGNEEKIDYRDVVADHKEDIEEKLNLHEYCTCKKIKSHPTSPHLCVKGHRLCFNKSKGVTNEEVALSAAEWSYLLKLGYRQDEAFYKELLASNTIEDAVIFLKHVEDEFIANGITVSSIPALRIESDREYEVDISEVDPASRREEILRKRYNKRE